MYQAIFSDIDGTLLGDDHQMTPATRNAILQCQALGIPFVLVSARSPGAMKHIQRKYGLRGPIIAYSGALVLDERGQAISRSTMTLAQSKAVIQHVTDNGFDAVWAVYYERQWVTPDRAHPRIVLEESIVEEAAVEMPLDALPDAPVYKTFFICHPDQGHLIVHSLRDRFPDFGVNLSSATNLECMPGGVSKARAVEGFCHLLQVDPKDAIAFGDNYNDASMLKAVGSGVIMGNAPQDLRADFALVAPDNNRDGVARMLEKLVFSAR